MASRLGSYVNDSVRMIDGNNGINGSSDYCKAECDRFKAVHHNLKSVI